MTNDQEKDFARLAPTSAQQSTADQRAHLSTGSESEEKR